MSKRGIGALLWSIIATASCGDGEARFGADSSDDTSGSTPSSHAANTATGGTGQTSGGGLGGGGDGGGLDGGGLGGGGLGGALGQPLELGLSFEEIALDDDPSFVTHFEFFPSASEFLATTRQGRVLHYALDQDETTLLGEFEMPDVFVEQDCGVISLTFDPDFETTGFVYFGYCVSLTESAVVRYRFDAGAYSDIAASAVEILRMGDAAATAAVHSVGKLGFDLNANLWVLSGEKGVSKNAQDPASPLGAVLRLRPKLEGGYEVPDPPNPEFAGSPALPLVYAYGLRSPWTGLLDSRGRFWVGDVGATGDDSIEEVNLIPGPGLNFGWNSIKGPCSGSCAEFSDPVRWWSRRPTSDFELEDPEVSPANSRVVWVGVEYMDDERDRYQGLMTNKVLYGDMCLGFVRAVEVDADMNVVFDQHVGHLSGASAWQVGPDGYIYAVTYARCTHGTGSELPPGKLMRARLDPAQ